jgi:ubiquinone/menaquinone biosynthesis C-methylase UbiE
LTSTVHSSGEDLDRMVQAIGARPDAMAIDVGCGGGHAAFRVAPQVRQIVAYDLSSAMLEVVRQEARARGLANLVTLRGSAEDMPFAPASFDVAVSRYSAHHWRDVKQALAQLRQVMKPGAVAVLIDVVSPGDPLLDTWLQSVELLRDASHVRDYSLSEWTGMLSTAGFAIGEMTTSRLRLEFGPWIERMQTCEQRVDAIHSLQERAEAEIMRHFSIEQDGTFSVDTAFIVARTRS